MVMAVQNHEGAAMTSERLVVRRCLEACAAALFRGLRGGAFQKACAVALAR